MAGQGAKLVGENPSSGEHEGNALSTRVYKGLGKRRVVQGVWGLRRYIGERLCSSLLRSVEGVLWFMLNKKLWGSGPPFIVQNRCRINRVAKWHSHVDNPCKSPQPTSWIVLALCLVRLHQRLPEQPQRQTNQTLIAREPAASLLFCCAHT